MIEATLFLLPRESLGEPSRLAVHVGMDEFGNRAKVPGIGCVDFAEKLHQAWRLAPTPIALWIAAAAEQVRAAQLVGNVPGSRGRDEDPTRNVVGAPLVSLLSPEQQQGFDVGHRGDAGQHETAYGVGEKL